VFEPPLAEAAISRYSRLVAITDASATVEHRVRSYLDANCAQCHRPGGTRGLFDARFDTPLSRQNLVGGPLAAADLGGRGASLISPGDPTRSALCARMNRRGDVYAMPPLASSMVDTAAVAVVAEWIKGLTPEKRPVGGGSTADSKP
jgi:mono/diheme cytochrome c family protein